MKQKASSNIMTNDVFKCCTSCSSRGMDIPRTFPVSKVVKLLLRLSNQENVMIAV
jgi:hypothetical protein